MPPTSSSSSLDTAPTSPLEEAPQRAARLGPVQRVWRPLRRAIYFVHRWLGIALALLMAVWALSGLVMMYVAFPETTREERLAGLEPLDLTGCCQGDLLPRAFDMQQASVEMLAGEPVLYWSGADGGGIISLINGWFVEPTQRTAMLAAATHMRQTTGAVPEYTTGVVELDQWTVYGRFRQMTPLYKFSFDDAAGTHLYVSGASGEVVQDTTAQERFWNWFGAVPHWLYFKAIRTNQTLWYNLVVYASLLGAFLTITGLYIGISRLRWGGRRQGRRSPYRGWALWHHWTGLIFGIFTLTWVASGLASMQPWGTLESAGPGDEMAGYLGRPAGVADVELMLAALARGDTGGAKTAELAVLQGTPYAILSFTDGSRARTSLPDLARQPASEKELARLAEVMRPGAPVLSQELIRQPDAYHYGHKREPILPAWRIIYDDEDRTRFYFDPRTGELINFVDAGARANRWLFNGLHRLDLFAALRQRPVWDIVVLPLMLGVCVLCVVGLVLGVKHLTRPRRRS